MFRQPAALKPSALLFATLLITACGGGGGGGGASETLNPQTTPPVAPPASTRLADTPAPAEATFDSYSATAVSIPEEVLTTVFIGTNRYLKIALETGEVLYLGIVPTSLNALPLSIPAGTTRLTYEVFTDSAHDSIVFGEIAL